MLWFMTHSRVFAGFFLRNSMTMHKKDMIIISSLQDSQRTMINKRICPASVWIIKNTNAGRSSRASSVLRPSSPKLNLSAIPVVKSSNISPASLTLMWVWMSRSGCRSSDMSSCFNFRESSPEEGSRLVMFVRFNRVIPVADCLIICPPKLI